MFISSSIIIVFSIIIIALLQYFIRRYIQKKDFKKRIVTISNEIEIVQNKLNHYDNQMYFCYKSKMCWADEEIKRDECKKEIEQLKKILAYEKLIQSQKKFKFFN
jgi:ERCC4-related helicase